MTAPLSYATRVARRRAQSKTRRLICRLATENWWLRVISGASPLNEPRSRRHLAADHRAAKNRRGRERKAVRA